MAGVDHTEVALSEALLYSHQTLLTRQELRLPSTLLIDAGGGTS
jgi:hypothetical protein